VDKKELETLDPLHVNVGLLSSVNTDRCPNLSGENIGLLKRLQDQVAELNSDTVDTVNKVVHFIRAKSLNYRQFVSLLEETVGSCRYPLPHKREMAEFGEGA
jgi:hypothetical protein